MIMKIVNIFERDIEESGSNLKPFLDNFIFFVTFSVCFRWFYINEQYSKKCNEIM